jgi:hypothetical protein
MINVISREAANKLQNKILSANVPLAVFVLYGSWTATKVTTASFADQCRKTPERLMGVYTLDASITELAEDFHEAGVR